METEKQMITKYLKGQQINEELIAEVLAFRDEYELDEVVETLVNQPEVLFYGKKILEMAVAALLHGEDKEHTASEVGWLRPQLTV